MKLIQWADWRLALGSKMQKFTFLKKVEGSTAQVY